MIHVIPRMSHNFGAEFFKLRMGDSFQICVILFERNGWFKIFIWPNRKTFDKIFIIDLQNILNLVIIVVHAQMI